MPKARTRTPKETKLSVRIDPVLRGRVNASAKLLGKSLEQFVCESLDAEVERLGFINDKRVATR